MEKPTQRPEGALIQQRIKSAEGVSIRSLADKADISEARVRQIINGYASAGRGQYVNVRAPQDTLANLALALGIEPGELESADRPDAAYALQARLDAMAEPGGFVELADLDEVQAWAESPFLYNPPEVILHFFGDDQLIAEVDRRLGQYRLELGKKRDQAWKAGDSHGATTEAQKMTQAEVAKAARNAGPGRPDFGTNQSNKP